MPSKQEQAQRQEKRAEKAKAKLQSAADAEARRWQRKEEVNVILLKANNDARAAWVVAAAVAAASEAAAVAAAQEKARIHMAAKVVEKDRVAAFRAKRKKAPPAQVEKDESEEELPLAPGEENEVPEDLKDLPLYFRTGSKERIKLLVDFWYRSSPLQKQLWRQQLEGDTQEAFMNTGTHSDFRFSLYLSDPVLVSTNTTTIRNKKASISIC